MKTAREVLLVMALAFALAGAIRPACAAAAEDAVLENFKARAKAEFASRDDSFAYCEASVVGEERDGGPGRLILLKCSNMPNQCLFAVFPDAEKPGDVVAHPVQRGSNPDYKSLVKS